MMRAQPLSRLAAAAAALVWVSTAAPPRAAAMDQTANPVRKLSRGLANAFAGVLEIPLTVSATSQKEGPVAAMTWGALVGFGAAVMRTAIGVAEVLTFPIPLPNVGYGPLLRPEFLLQP